MNKRDFVRGAGAVLVVGGVAAAAKAAQACGSAASAASGDGRLADWQSRLGETFQLLSDAAPTSLLLERVEVHDIDTVTEQFTLTFAARGGAAPATGTHLLRQGDGRMRALYLHAASRAGADEVAQLRADCSHLI
jgi:hypothetical protein